jgi:hypothetical protein
LRHGPQGKPHPKVSSSRLSRGPINQRTLPVISWCRMLPGAHFASSQLAEKWVLATSARMTPLVGLMVHTTTTLTLSRNGPRRFKPALRHDHSHHHRRSAPNKKARRGFHSPRYFRLRRLKVQTRWPSGFAGKHNHRSEEDSFVRIGRRSMLSLGLGNAFARCAGRGCCETDST